MLGGPTSCLLLMGRSTVVRPHENCLPQRPYRARIEISAPKPVMWCSIAETLGIARAFIEWTARMLSNTADTKEA